MPLTCVAEEKKWDGPQLLPANPRIKKISDVVRLVEIDPSASLNDFSEILETTRTTSELFEVHLGCAKAYFIQGQLVSSETHLNLALNLLKQKDCLKEVPWKYAEISKCFALICVERNDDKGALRYFKEGWKACKSHKELTSEYIKFLESRESHSKAVLKLCDEGIETGLGSPELFYTRAKVHYFAKEWLKAHRDCISYLKAGSDHPSREVEILNIGAECARELRLYKVACKHLEPCQVDPSPRSQITRSKKHLEAKLRLAPLVLASTGILEFSLKMRKAIRTFPEEAFEIFTPLLDLLEKPTDLFEALLCSAAACIEGKDPLRFKSARGSLLRALQLLSKDSAQFSQESIGDKKAMAFQWLARLCIREKKFEEAQKHFEESWKISKMTFLEPIGYLPDNQEDCEHALGFCNVALIFSKDPNIFVSRAKIYGSQNKWEAARIDCECFLKENPSDENLKLEILDLAAKSCLNLKDITSAYGYMLDAYRLDSSEKVIQRFEELEELFDEETVDENLMPTLLPILDTAGKMENSEGALKLFDYILDRRHEIIDNFDLAAALIGRAKACAESKFKQRFPFARRDLEEADKLISETDASQVEKDEMKAEIFCCFASMDIEEDKPGAALKNFQEGWALAKIHSLRLAYSQFLASQKKLKEALDICSEGNIDEMDVVWCRSYVYFDFEMWGQLFKVYDDLLQPERLEVSKQLLVLDDAIRASIKIKDWQRAEKYALKVCKRESSAALIQRIKTLMEMYRNRIADHHLENLRQTAGSRISYLSLVLEIFHEELVMHPKHHVDLLEARGKKFLAKEKLDKSRNDYLEIEKIYNANVGILEKEEEKGS